MNRSPQESLSSLADTICTSILGTLGRSSVESIFLSGSAAGGAVAWFNNGGFVEIYSDLDVFVVVAPGVDCARAKSAARSLIPGLPIETGEYRLFRAPDIGVYDESDLLSQPARPGTAEIPLRFRMLYGRDDVILRVRRRFDASNIAREEALYLLENRLMEQASLRARADGDHSDGFARSMFYAGLKHCLDAASAVLMAEGAYVCGMDDRMKLFKSLSASAGIALAKEWLDLIDYSYGHLGNLQGAMLSENARFDAIGRRSEALLLTAWKTIAASIFGCAPGTGWEDLVRARSRAHSLGSALRETRADACPAGRLSELPDIRARNFGRKPLRPDAGIVCKNLIGVRSHAETDGHRHTDRRSRLGDCSTPAVLPRIARSLGTGGDGVRIQFRGDTVPLDGRAALGTRFLEYVPV
ncbi:MAG: hypothetical protein HY770_07990 [Chitinivibrionia bacterium]|nr:hypothetical protein [Chitinivibrionia bacterium]